MTARAAGKPLVALLRGINVSGQKAVPMQQLRKLATELGCTHAETYIQSGNLVVVTKLSAQRFEAALEQALETHFGFHVDVIARTREAWLEYAKGSPFPDAEAERAKWLVLGVCKGVVKADCLSVLHKYAKDGERFAALEDAVWLDFPNGQARTKLTPSVMDRAAGSSLTGRNFRTVNTLADMLRALK